MNKCAEDRFAKKQQEFWGKMDDPSFWEVIKPSKYIRTPCNTITHCNKLGEVYIDRIIEILWDYAKKCILIQDGTNWYHLSHTMIQQLTVRQIIDGIVSNKYMESKSSNILDMIAHKAPLFKVRVLDLDDMDICEKH